MKYTGRFTHTLQRCWLLWARRSGEAMTTLSVVLKLQEELSLVP
jgi:hypothetical protein